MDFIGLLFVEDERFDTELFAVDVEGFDDSECRDSVSEVRVEEFFEEFHRSLFAAGFEANKGAIRLTELLNALDCRVAGDAGAGEADGGDLGGVF